MLFIRKMYKMTYTNELVTYILDTQTVLVDGSLNGGLSAYDGYVSDHRPVMLKILVND